MLRILGIKQLDGGEHMNTKSGKPFFEVLPMYLNIDMEFDNYAGSMFERMHNIHGTRW